MPSKSTSLPRAVAVVAIATLLCGVTPESVQASNPEPEARQIAPGTSTRAARREAIAAIPFEQIDPAYRQRVQQIIDRQTIFRRMPTMVSRCEPKLHQFVADHPELLANVWKVLGIDDVALIPTGPDSYRAEDGAGTTGTVEFLYRDENTQVILAEGTYDGPLFRNPVVGRGILLLKSGYRRETDGHDYVTARLDAFIQLDHAAASFLTKTFQPLVVRAADNTFAQTAIFLERLSQAAECQPGGLTALAGRLDDLTPPVRDDFILVTAGVAAKAVIRDAQMARRAESRTARRASHAAARK